MALYEQPSGFSPQADNLKNLKPYKAGCNDYYINKAKGKTLEWVKQFIISIRNIRAEMKVAPSVPLTVLLKADAMDAARANANENGLGGSVWSSDVAVATALAMRLESGTAWVNDHASISPDARMRSSCSEMLFSISGA